MVTVIAREVTPGDRLQVGDKDYLVTAIPKYLDDDTVQVPVVMIGVGQSTHITTQWNTEFRVVVPPSPDHPTMTEKPL